MGSSRSGSSAGASAAGADDPIVPRLTAALSSAAGGCGSFRAAREPNSVGADCNNEEKQDSRAATTGEGGVVGKSGRNDAAAPAKATCIETGAQLDTPNHRVVFAISDTSISSQPHGAGHDGEAQEEESTALKGDALTSLGLDREGQNENERGKTNEKGVVARRKSTGQNAFFHSAGEVKQHQTGSTKMGLPRRRFSAIAQRASFQPEPTAGAASKGAQQQKNMQQGRPPSTKSVMSTSSRGTLSPTRSYLETEMSELSLRSVVTISPAVSWMKVGSPSVSFSEYQAINSVHDFEVTHVEFRRGRPRNETARSAALLKKLRQRIKSTTTAAGSGIRRSGGGGGGIGSPPASFTGATTQAVPANNHSTSSVAAPLQGPNSSQREPVSSQSTTSDTNTAA
mmetsp:Transcript_17242/g.37491  ORF Transcript_17242/g.37491 Transcript_17242/m.37491 type:complete len:398 (-) Transcript_17242:198-1391(-)